MIDRRRIQSHPFDSRARALVVGGVHSVVENEFSLALPGVYFDRDHLGRANQNALGAFLCDYEASLIESEPPAHPGR